MLNQITFQYKSKSQPNKAPDSLNVYLLHNMYNTCNLLFSSGKTDSHLRLPR